jgi:Reverse transcriptase (RNA-dependent DNA polymerase)
MSSTPTPDPPPESGQHDSSNNGRRNRRLGRSGRKHANREAEVDAKAKISGKIDQLEGHIYDVASSSPTDSFTRTTEEIALYVSSNLDKAGEYRIGLVNMYLPPVPRPVPPQDQSDVVLAALFGEEIKMYSRALEARRNNQGKVFGIILGQCTKAMKDQIEADSNWTTVNAGTDVIGLLKLIRAHSHGAQPKREASHLLLDAIQEFYGYRQEYVKNRETVIMGVSEYYQGFKERLENLERVHGPVGQDEPRVMAYISDVMHSTASVPNEVTMRQARAACRERFLATTLIFHASPSKFGNLHSELQNNHVLYRSPYPNTLSEAYEILVSRLKIQEDQKRSGKRDDILSHPSFFQDEHGHSGRGRGRGRGSGRGRNGGDGGGATNADDSAGSNPAHPARGTANSAPNNSASTTSQSVTDYLPSPPTVSHTAPGISLHQHTDCSIPGTWIILDSASTIDMFVNADLLIDIREANQPLRIISNAGNVLVHQQGTLPGYPFPVWYHPGGAANVLSLFNIQQCFKVTLTQHGMTVHVSPRNILQFSPNETGLYHLDTQRSGHRSSFSFLTTVNDKKAEYTRRGVQQAALARRVQNIIMRPPVRRYMDIISKNFIRNCPIERRHIQAAEDIYGPNVGALQGKTPRRETGHVIAQVDPVPDEILATHRDVTIAIDLMFINKIPFLITISRGLHIGSIHALDNRQADTVAKSLLYVLRRYKRRGFRINTILADDEFQAVATLLPRYNFNLCGADEHVPDVERYIRTTKDTIRSAYNDMPFQFIPRIMVVRLAENAIFWQNAFPHPDSIAPDHSPRYLIEGRRIDYDKHVRIPFGAYAHTHEQHDNTMAPRTISAICMGPTGNEQGAHYFYSVATGRLLTRPHFTELPMPDDIIARISTIGRNQGMPPTLTFSNRYGHELIDDGDDIDDDHDPDYDYEPSDDDASTSTESFASSSASDDSTSTSGSDPDLGPGDDLSSQSPAGVEIGDPNVNRQGGGHYAGNQRPTNRHNIPRTNGEQIHRANTTVGDGNRRPTLDTIIIGPGHTGTADDDTDHDSDDEAQDQHYDSDDSTQNHTDQHPYDNNGHSTPTIGIRDQTRDELDGTLSEEIPGVDAEAQIMNEEITGVGQETTGVVLQGEQNTHNLRPRRGRRDPTHLLGRGFEDEFIFLTAQMSAKKGLKIFGQPGADAIVAELQQVHYRRVVKPVMGNSLTKEQKRAALHYLMFLKQKRCGKIKARGCADGRKQRLWKTKEETSSPTVRTESVFISAMIDARENRAVMTCDIPGAFMQADIDETVHVKFEGEIADLLVKVDPKVYTPFLKYEYGKPVIYVELQKALYGTLQAAMLFWKELTAYLVDELGFVINPYDRCVANKIVNGKQCTILWHVDDLKISHVDQQVLEDILDSLNRRFGKEQPLTVTRGAVHDYLGMTIDYSKKGEVQFSMVDFIDGILSDVPEDMSTGTSATPAAEHLFDVNAKAERLSKEDAETFHTLVAKLLYLCKRTRPDIHTAVAFLTTRVSKPDVDDYKKLRRVVRYLRGTRDLPMTLEVDDISTIKWWVDAAFAVHPDMRGQTGATMSLGKGAVYSSSTRQKINTRSSTEAELVGVEEAMTGIVWTRNFLESQGVNVHDNVVYQDNQSAMLLEKNGTASSGKRTRHINIRYYFVKDRIDSGELRVEYCPTEDMLADIFTKPLQGALFRKFRDQLLNVKHVDIRSTSSQECVETQYFQCQSAESNTLIDQSGMDADILKMNEVADDGWKIVKNKKRKATRMNAIG